MALALRRTSLPQAFVEAAAQWPWGSVARGVILILIVVFVVGVKGLSTLAPNHRMCAMQATARRTFPRRTIRLFLRICLKKPAIRLSTLSIVILYAGDRIVTRVTPTLHLRRSGAHL